MNTVLASNLDYFAPLKSRCVSFARSAPWYNDELRSKKVACRKLERKFHKTKHKRDDRTTIYLKFQEQQYFCVFEDVMYQSARIPPPPPPSIFRCNRDLNFSGEACVIQYVWPFQGAGSLTFLLVNKIDTSGLIPECVKTTYPSTIEQKYCF